MPELARIDAAAAWLRGRGLGQIGLGLVLGSGLKGFGERVTGAVEIPFADVPEWPAPRVEGHGGSLVVGDVQGLRVACLTGRVHLYEGWTPAEIVRAVRTLRRLGVPRFLLTNAAGGIDRSFAAGDLMVIRDHLNMTGQNALLGEHEPDLGPRFPDMSTVYVASLRELLHEVDGRLREGIYAGNLGPAYETPAQIDMLARAGAHAVGMSTVLEAEALCAMEAEIAGISLISNLAAGISDQPLSHQEVIEVGKQAETRMVALVEGFCAKLSSP